jgi:hypothetical protein
MNEQVPRSPHELVGGLVYFGRMIDKIRLQKTGALRPDLQPNLGRAFDATCCEFLGVNYEALCAQVEAGLSDDALLAWCEEEGRPLPAYLRILWNQAMTRRGWQDDLSSRLQERLAEGGWSDRTDIQTMFDYIDLDEGRDPRDFARGI